MVDFSKIWGRQVQAAENNAAREVTRGASKFFGGLIGEGVNVIKDIVKDVRQGVKEGLPQQQQPVRERESSGIPPVVSRQEKREILEQFRKDAPLMGTREKRAEADTITSPAVADALKGQLVDSFQLAVNDVAAPDVRPAAEGPAVAARASAPPANNFG